MSHKGDSEIKSICMLSTHGYFDPVPQLGRTDTGGQVVYVLELSKALSTRNIKVDIYTRWCEASKPQIDPVPGYPDVRVIRIPSGACGFVPKEEIYDFLTELVENMIAFIKENGLQYDLYHGHYVDAGIVALDVARAFDKPAFFTAHSLGAWKRAQMGGDPEEMERKYKFSHRIAEEFRVFKSVKAQTVTTAVQKEKLEQLYGYKVDDVVVIPPGVDVHTFRPLERGEEKKTELPDRYIFCLSRIDANKGHDLLLNAFDLVRKEVPDVHLVIGGGSPQPKDTELEVLTKIKAIIEGKGLHDRAHVIGYVPDGLMVPSYQQAEFFVLPSIFEPFGMTVLEAMACGTPVVASRFGGIREVISSGKNGLLVDPSNTSQFAKAMVRLLKNRDFADNMGQKGRQTIQKQFSWEAIAGKHVAFYERFMGL